MAKQIILTSEYETHLTIFTKTYDDSNQLIEVETYTRHHDGQSPKETVTTRNQPHQFSRDERRMSFDEAVNAYETAGFFKVETVTE